MQRALSPGNAFIDSEPVAADEFAALMEAFAPLPPSRFAVAVSGGPDSMALAYCVKRWSDDGLALVVDHGLRPESATEAENTCKELSKLGMATEVLRWEHPPVVARLHVTAREARYGLLAEACRRHGIRDLLLAHQREDQAETILMRLAKGSGVDGLAGMKPETWVDGVRLMRPFLSMPKARLVATCRAANIEFLADPSNASEKFARGRLRRVLPLLEPEGLSVERLLDLGARAAEAREALDHYTRALLRVASRRDEAGVIAVDLEHLRAAPRAIAARALSACFRHINPAAYAPERASLMPVLDALCGDRPMEARTLHGCGISKNEADALIMREYAAIGDANIIRAGETVTWDKRWNVTLGANAETVSYTIRPLGNPTHGVLDRLAPGLRHKVPQGRARAGLPSLWQADGLALIPSLETTAGPADARAWLAKPWSYQ